MYDHQLDGITIKNLSDINIKQLLVIDQWITLPCQIVDQQTSHTLHLGLFASFANSQLSVTTHPLQLGQAVVNLNTTDNNLLREVQQNDNL
jgi:hypothetical protein